MPGPRRSSSDETNSILPDGVGKPPSRYRRSGASCGPGTGMPPGCRPISAMVMPVGAKIQSSASGKETAGSAPPSGSGLSSGSSSPSRWARSKTMSVSDLASPSGAIAGSVSAIHFSG